MIVHIDYDSPEYNLKYILNKYLPNIFYPFLLKHLYKKKFGRDLNLKNPKRLSEKILYSVLYDRNPMKTLLSDRLEAKKYVAKLIPDLKSAKVYQIVSSFKNFDFNKVPETFVIKTNHAWKSHVFVKNKNQLTQEFYNRYKKFYDKVIKINYAYWGTPELQYKNIKPKLFIEEYLCSNDCSPYIKEYEVYCFNGKPEFINYSISYNGFPEAESDTTASKGNYLQTRCFDTKWNKTDFKIRFDSDLLPPDSINKDRILEYAICLSTGFQFVRVDFFEVSNQLFFGEFTFSPFSGFIEFLPEKYDLFYGNKY